MREVSMDEGVSSACLPSSAAPPCSGRRLRRSTAIIANQKITQSPVNSPLHVPVKRVLTPSILKHTVRRKLCKAEARGTTVLCRCPTSAALWTVWRGETAPFASPAAFAHDDFCLHAEPHCNGACLPGSGLDSLLHAVHESRQVRLIRSLASNPDATISFVRVFGDADGWRVLLGNGLMLAETILKLKLWSPSRTTAAAQVFGQLSADYVGFQVDDVEAALQLLRERLRPSRLCLERIFARTPLVETRWRRCVFDTFERLRSTLRSLSEQSTVPAWYWPFVALEEMVNERQSAVERGLEDAFRQAFTRDYYLDRRQRRCVHVRDVVWSCRNAIVSNNYVRLAQIIGSLDYRPIHYQYRLGIHFHDRWVMVKKRAVARPFFYNYWSAALLALTERQGGGDGDGDGWLDLCSRADALFAAFAKVSRTAAAFDNHYRANACLVLCVCDLVELFLLRSPSWPLADTFCASARKLIFMANEAPEMDMELVSGYAALVVYVRWAAAVDAGDVRGDADEQSASDACKRLLDASLALPDARGYSFLAAAVHMAVATDNTGETAEPLLVAFVTLHPLQAANLCRLVDLFHSPHLKNAVVEQVEAAMPRPMWSSSDPYWLVWAGHRLAAGGNGDALVETTDRLLNFLDFAENRADTDAWRLLRRALDMLVALPEAEQPTQLHFLWLERCDWWPRFHAPTTDEPRPLVKARRKALRRLVRLMEATNFGGC